MNDNEKFYWVTGGGFMAYALLAEYLILTGAWPLGIIWSVVGGMLLQAHLQAMIEVSR